MLRVLEGPVGAIIGAAALIWATTGVAILFRVAWLRSSGRSPGAPALGSLLFGDFGTALFNFTISSQHRRLGDGATTRLIWVARCALGTLWISVALCIVVVLRDHLR